MKILVFFLVWMSISTFALAQTVVQDQFWLGIMTQYRVGEKSLVWNDFHYVPGGFTVLRTGYTHETNVGRFTVGFAHLWLPDGQETMKRDEWRPWGQWFLPKKIKESNWQYHLRIRYDARFREEIVDGNLISNEFAFNNRYRFQGVLRYNLFQLTEKDKLYLAVGGEILINHKNNQYWMDQHRRNITIGVARKGFNFQTGYMNRQNYGLVGEKTQINHTWINWFILEF